MYKDLVEVTQKCCDLMGIDVDVFVERDEETGRFYLCGRYANRMAFNGQLYQNESVLTEEIYRGNEKLAYDLFTMHFNPNRIAYMKATDEEVMAFNGHPDLFPVEVAA